MSSILLESLDAGQYDTAFFLTYTLNLRFFEWLVLPRLRRMGVTHIGILVDHTGYAETLRDPGQQSECGRSYIVAPVRLRGGGIQHAKAVWLSGKQGHRALVGSHNLTMSGFNDQLEVTTELRSNVPEHTAALRDLHEAITEIRPELLRDIWARVPRPTVSVDAADAPVRLLTSLRESLEDQLVRYVGPASALRVVTPFLEAAQLEQLATRLGATDVTLDIPHEGLDIALTSATARLPALQPRTLPASEKRRLHAKGYEFRADGVMWSASGSANCTTAALGLNVTEGGNLEFMVLARDAVLPAEIVFEPIADPATYPCTGRAWNDGRAGGTLVVTQAEYRSPDLIVGWEVAGRQAPELVEVRAGDGPTRILESNPAPIALDGPPPSTVTLTALIGEDLVEARGWVTNYHALALFAQRAHEHVWSERVASGNTQRLAGAFEELVTQALEFGRWDDQPRSPQVPSAHGTKADESAATHERELREVFIYSDDAERVRHAAERLLTGPQSTDPLTLSWAFLARIGHVERALNDSELVDDGASSHGAGGTPAPQRTAMFRLVAYLIARLNARATAWQRDTPKGAEAATLIRLIAAWVTMFGLEVRRNSELAEKRRPLVEAYTSVVQTIPPDVVASLGLAVRGPLALSLGVVGDMAIGELQFLHDKLARALLTITNGDPRSLLIAWRTRYSDQADTLFIDHHHNGERFELLAGLAERLIGKVSPDKHQRLHQQWGLLAALQESDVNRLPTRDALYAQAKTAYQGTRVWDKYVAARQRGALPILLRARNRRCPICGLTLSNVEERLLDGGHALMSCKHIIVLDY